MLSPNIYQIIPSFPVFLLIFRTKLQCYAIIYLEDAIMEQYTEKFLKNRSDKVTYGIIRRTYNPFLNIKEERAKATKDFNKALYAYTKSNSITISEKHLIILWSGLETDKFLKKIGHSNDFLLSCLANELKDRKDVVDLYIYSPLDLVEEGDNTVAIALSRITKLWHEAEIVPEFLTNNFLDMPPLNAVSDNELATYKATHQIEDLTASLFDSLTESSTASPLMEQLLKASNAKADEYIRKAIIRSKEKPYFERFFNSIHTLDSLYKKEQPEISSYVLNYIDCYFKWQTNQMTMLDITNNIEPDSKETGMSKTRFYDHNKKFEESPVYPEYCNCFASQIRHTSKKGTVPDFCHFLAYYNWLSEQQYNPDDLIYEIYMSEPIQSLWDVARIEKRSLQSMSTFIHKYGQEAFETRLLENMNSIKKKAAN